MLNRYREILTHQDSRAKRNPIHYAAMSKFTNSFKTLEAILDIDFDIVPGYKAFADLYMQLQGFEAADETFDPRRCHSVLQEFKRLMRPQDFNMAVRDFKRQVDNLLKEVLNQ